MKIKILFAFIAWTTLAFGQSKMVWIQQADKFYDKGDYANALALYEKALDNESIKGIAVLPYEYQLTNQKFAGQSKKVKVAPHDYVRHQVAMCQMYTFDYKRAEEHFNITKDLSAFESDRYYYANALKNNGKCDEAIVQYDIFIHASYSPDSMKHLAQQAKSGCEFAKTDKVIRPGVEVELLGQNFNVGTSNFASTYFGTEDRIMFSSARAGGVILSPDQKSEFLCDLYWMEKKDGQWGEAVNFGRPLNSAQHDAGSAFNGGNVIFYTRWSDVNRKIKTIYLARMMDFKFFEAYQLDEKVNVPGYSSMQPFVSKDGKFLYFSSDRPGGKGGFDIWKIELDEAGNTLGEAINLGYPVNSIADEVAPFMHEKSSTLFYSSNGFNSIGGLDVFKSDYNLDKETFTYPENVGEPINSTRDDVYFIMDEKLEEGMVSSDRQDCEFGHCMQIYKVTNGAIVVELEGNSYDADTDQILANVTLTFKDVKDSERSMVIKTDENGYYFTSLTLGDEWFIKANKQKYFSDANVVDTRPVTESTRLRTDFRLAKIPLKEISIDGIEYDFNSATLRPASMEILDRLYDFLIFNETLIVELNSHTDSRGSDKYNLDLSQRRAQSCVDYLVSKGLDPARMKAIGYGETDPVVITEVVNGQTKEITLTEAYINQFMKKNKAKFEELHQKNRRTAFKVVGDNFELKSNNHQLDEEE